jgi:N-acetylneuraminate lyase
MPVQDIQLWKDEGGEDFIVFNGPDEQFLAGLSMGAAGGIGGTYAAMPALFLKVWELYHAGDMARAARVQNDICRIIYAMCACQGNLYAVIKAILKRLHGLELGSVRAPLPPLQAGDEAQVAHCCDLIAEAIRTHC